MNDYLNQLPKSVHIYEYQLLVLPADRFTPVKTKWFYHNQDKR